MKVSFDIVEKKFTGADGQEIKYYVLSRPLVDGSTLEITIKGDKVKLLMMSLKIEGKN